MTTASTVTLAETFISLITRNDTNCHCEKIAPGRYAFSDTTVEGSQAATAVDVVAGVFTWATEALDDMTSQKSEVAIASAVLSNRFDDALELSIRTDSQVSQKIWNRVRLFAARSGRVATLHSPSGSETAKATVAV